MMGGRCARSGPVATSAAVELVHAIPALENGRTRMRLPVGGLLEEIVVDEPYFLQAAVL
jgi:hypothetical protein